MNAQPAGTGSPPPQGAGPTPLQQNARKANEQIRRRSPYMFIVAGLCFFLPFITISCSGQKIATLSGRQLVTGAEITIENPVAGLEEEFGTTTGEEAPSETEETDPSIWAIVALAAAVLGIAVGFVLKGRARSIGSIAAALIGLVGLIGLRFDLEGDVEEAEGLVVINYRIGYWLVALFFVLLGIAHGMFLRAGRQSATGPPGPAP